MNNDRFALCRKLRMRPNRQIDIPRAVELARA
jgi:hypothetical protein